jgi:hypothetical protein
MHRGKISQVVAAADNGAGSPGKFGRGFCLSGGLMFRHCPSLLVG